MLVLLLLFSGQLCCACGVHAPDGIAWALRMVPVLTLLNLFFFLFCNNYVIYFSCLFYSLFCVGCVHVCVYNNNAKQKHLGCKKSARPIRSHNGYISDQKL